MISNVGGAEVESAPYNLPHATHDPAQRAPPGTAMIATATDLALVRPLGLAAEREAQAATLLAQARHALAADPVWAWWVPGRIEVLGKHTDYAGGQVLNCAADVGLLVVARPRGDAVVRVRSKGQEVAMALQAGAQGAPGMATYVAAVVRRLARHFPGLDRGVDIGVAANLPAASGMSSSSALVIAVHLALAAANRLDARADFRAGLGSDEQLVPYLGCHESGAGCGAFPGEAGVGTSGGSQDHAAILLSRTGHLNQWSFAPFQRLGTVAWPERLELAVAVSGVLAEKSAAARTDFNEVAGRARAAGAAWNAATGRADASLGAAFLACGAPAVLAAIADPDLRQRAEQVASETTEIVPGAVAALACGDLRAFAALTARSQAMAVTHLRNQIPETRALADSAAAHGAVAASAFGAGFGGAVWAAFPRGADGPAAWLADYRRRFPQHAAVAALQRIAPGPGVTALETA